MFNQEQMLKVLETFEDETGVSKEKIKEILQEAFQMAYHREFDPEGEVETVLNLETGALNVFKVYNVVEDDKFEDDLTEIPLSEARKIDVTYGLGSKHLEELDISQFSRTAIMNVFQVVRQKINEQKKADIYAKYKDRKGSIMNVEVENVDENFILVVLDGTFGIMPKRAQIPGEVIHPGQIIKVYVEEVQEASRGWQVEVSRAHPMFVKALFENEVPEIGDGTVEIKSVSRIAGQRTKIAVYSSDASIDPIGACIGQGGSRANAVIQQINGEKIDIINYSEDPVEFICNAILPAKATGVQIVSNDDKKAILIVPEEQLSLAIGRRGSSAKLAVMLTGWNLDIKSDKEAEELELAYIKNEYTNVERKPRARVENPHAIRDIFDDPMFIDQDKEIKRVNDEKDIYEEFGEEYSNSETEEFEDEEIDWDEYDEE